MPDELTAGPEADALVGEAMGIEPRREWMVSDDGGESMRANTDPRNGPWWTEQQLRHWFAEQQAKGFHLDCEILPWLIWPRYTTSGNGMLAMLEWMDAKGWFWKVENSPCGCTVFLSPGTQTPYILAGTAPLAVAKALLAAVAATEEPKT